MKRILACKRSVSWRMSLTSLSTLYSNTCGALHPIWVLRHTNNTKKHQLQQAATSMKIIPSTVHWRRSPKSQARRTITFCSSKSHHRLRQSEEVFLQKPLCNQLTKMRRSIWSIRWQSQHSLSDCYFWSTSSFSMQALLKKTKIESSSKLLKT